jgi:hypothetical protein
MQLTPTQIKCLVAIRQGRGNACLRGYRFNSAQVLDRLGLIEGNRDEPYWTWKLTSNGLWALRLAMPVAS